MKCNFSSHVFEECFISNSARHKRLHMFFFRPIKSQARSFAAASNKIVHTNICIFGLNNLQTILCVWHTFLGQLSTLTRILLSTHEFSAIRITYFGKFLVNSGMASYTVQCRHFQMVKIYRKWQQKPSVTVWYDTVEIYLWVCYSWPQANRSRTE